VVLERGQQWRQEGGPRTIEVAEVTQRAGHDRLVAAQRLRARQTFRLPVEQEQEDHETVLFWGVE
jgi:hypothetical protein